MARLAHDLRRRLRAEPGEKGFGQRRIERQLGRELDQQHRELVAERAGLAQKLVHQFIGAGELVDMGDRLRES